MSPADTPAAPRRWTFPSSRFFLPFPADIGRRGFPERRRRRQNPPPSEESICHWRDCHMAARDHSSTTPCSPLPWKQREGKGWIIVEEVFFSFSLLKRRRNSNKSPPWHLSSWNKFLFQILIIFYRFEAIKYSITLSILITESGKKCLWLPNNVRNHIYTPEGGFRLVKYKIWPYLYNFTGIGGGLGVLGAVVFIPIERLLRRRW